MHLQSTCGRVTGIIRIASPAEQRRLFHSFLFLKSYDRNLRPQGVNFQALNVGIKAQIFWLDPSRNKLPSCSCIV